MLFYLPFSNFAKFYRVQINFSELHHEKLCEKKKLTCIKGPQWLRLRDRIF